MTAIQTSLLADELESLRQLAHGAMRKRANWFPTPA